MINDLSYTILGKDVTIPTSPSEAVLTPIPNPHPTQLYCSRFTCPEFTSLCPVTGQPDFAHIVIDIVPGDYLVESKSLKLFLFSFRNHGAFHEDCTVMVGERINEAIKPVWMRVAAYWYPRGGIPIDVLWQTDDPDEHALGNRIFQLTTPDYRGRG